MILLLEEFVELYVSKVPFTVIVTAELPKLSNSRPVVVEQYGRLVFADVAIATMLLLPLLAFADVTEENAFLLLAMLFLLRNKNEKRSSLSMIFISCHCWRCCCCYCCC